MSSSDWPTLVLTAVPLFAIAGSGIAYVVKLYRDADERRHTRFFELLRYIGGNEGIGAKVGAAYALRNFPEHAEFVERFCLTNKAQVTGDNAQSLIDEMQRTADFFGAKKQQ